MKLILLLWLFVCLQLSAQTTKTITIQTPSGKPVAVKFTDLKNCKLYTIDSLQILNHLKEYKSTLRNIKGVLLKDVLAKVQFGEESPKVLSEYYITCIADDNYKVVFSWNELFNNPAGDRVLVVTDINGNPSAEQYTGIVLVTPTDVATGRRYVKNLKTIKIERVK